MQLQLESPKCSQVKIELELLETLALYQLLEHSTEQVAQSEDLTKLRKTVGRIVRSRQFRDHYRAEVYEVIAKVKTMIGK
jgi:hypothetical protein